MMAKAFTNLKSQRFVRLYEAAKAKACGKGNGILVILNWTGRSVVIGTVLGGKRQFCSVRFVEKWFSGVDGGLDSRISIEMERSLSLLVRQWCQGACSVRFAEMC